jgi:hypothetical protein
MNTAMVRMIIVSGVTGLLCTTMSLPANATLPGNGYINEYYAFSPAGTQVTLDSGIKSSEMTCFLNEVVGDLKGTPDVDVGGAGVFDPHDGSDWQVQYGNNTSGASMATGISCVWSTTNVIDTRLMSGGIGSGPGSWTIPGTDSNSQCFLQAIAVADTSFNSSSAKVVVSRDSSGVWTLNNVSVGADVQSDATCVDIPGAAWFMENNWTGLFTVTAFLQTSTSPVVCGLRGFEGQFESTANTVGVFSPSSLPGNWFLSTDSGVDRGWITCLQ